MFDNFWLSQSEQPNFVYPQMHNNIKTSSLLHSSMNKPFHIRKNLSAIKRTHLKMPKLSKKAIFIKEYEAVLASWVVKAYIHFCFDDEDSYEDEIDDCMVAELAVLKSLQYIFWGSYRQWESDCECMLYDDMYLADDEFLSHFCRINLVSCN